MAEHPECPTIRSLAELCNVEPNKRTVQKGNERYGYETEACALYDVANVLCTLKADAMKALCRKATSGTATKPRPLPSTTS